MRQINYLFVHCSDTSSAHDVHAADIRHWHKERGWKNPGYHDLITRSGTTEHLLDFSEIANGVKGYNARSIHVCLAGGKENGKPSNNFTALQFNALRKYIMQVKRQFPRIQIRGHNEVAARDCPCFNVQEFLKTC